MFVKMKVAGITFITFSCIFFILGISTFFWTPVKSYVKDYSTSTTIQYGYTNVEYLTAACNGGDHTAWQSIEYNYTFNSTEYNSSFIGFYLPFNNELSVNSEPNYKKSITAYVLPFKPSIAIVKQGFDYRLVGAFLFIGLSILFIRVELIKYTT